MVPNPIGSSSDAEKKKPLKPAAFSIADPG